MTSPATGPAAGPASTPHQARRSGAGLWRAVLNQLLGRPDAAGAWTGDGLAQGLPRGPFGKAAQGVPRADRGPGRTVVK